MVIGILCLPDNFGMPPPKIDPIDFLWDAANMFAQEKKTLLEKEITMDNENRAIKLITKDEALKIRQSCQELPGELLDKVNAIIRIQLEQGKEEIILRKIFVTSELQWDSLLKRLVANGWNVREEQNSGNEDAFAILKF